MGSAVRLKFLVLFFSFSSICVLRKENVFPIKWGRWREDRETQCLTRIESEGPLEVCPIQQGWRGACSCGHGTDIVPALKFL